MEYAEQCNITGKGGSFELTSGTARQSTRLAVAFDSALSVDNKTQPGVAFTTLCDRDTPKVSLNCFYLRYSITVVYASGT